MDHSRNELPGYAAMVSSIADESQKLDGGTEQFVIDRLFYDLSKRTADMLNAADNFREQNGMPRMYGDVISALGR